MNLYQIQTSYRELINKVEAASGELSPELEFELKLNEHDFREKATAYCVVVTEKQFQVDGLEAEIKRLTIMRDKGKQTMERLKGKLLEAVIERGPQTVGLWELRTFKSHSVEVQPVPDDEFKWASLPTDCKRTTVEPDKTAIRNKLNAGQEVPGCRLIERQNLIIR
jgi:hypothetical protein